jgi:glutamyl-tRNA synthetase
MRSDLAPGGARRDWFLRVLETLKARSKVIPDFARDARPFLSDEFEYAPDAVAKHLAGGGKAGGPQDVAARMKALREVLSGVTPFDEASAEAALRALAERRGETAALFIHPLRVALVGTAVSPGIFAILVLIGRERAVARLDRLARFLAGGGIDTPRADH